MWHILIGATTFTTTFSNTMSFGYAVHIVNREYLNVFTAYIKNAGLTDGRCFGSSSIISRFVKLIFAFTLAAGMP
jgi:hypothetical protein